jgi:hypothetical protein
VVLPNLSAIEGVAKARAEVTAMLESHWKELAEAQVEVTGALIAIRQIEKRG